MRAAHQVQEWIDQTEAAIEDNAESDVPEVAIAVREALGRIEGMKVALGEIEADRVKANNLLDTLNMVIREQAAEIADRDRVIARLLDGWGATEDLDELLWIGGPNGDDVYEAMSDGEAAIIRQHQGKAQ